MSEHTPGPWHTNSTGRIFSMTGKPGATPLIVGVASSDHHSLDERHANALLMALAPDLLDVARRARYVLSGIAHVGVPDLVESLDDVLSRVAEGE